MEITQLFSGRTLTQVAKAIETLAAGKVAGSIMNVDFKESKDILSRAFEKSWDAMVREKILTFNWSDPADQTRGLLSRPENQWMNFDYTSPSFQSFNKMNRLIAAAPAESEITIAAKAVLSFFRPYVADLNELKSKIVKGRRPSTTPRLTPARTIENTGTCAVCGMNVKLSGTRIVAHGFQLKWQMGRLGNCFGVGYPPIETSPEGAIVYLAIVKKEIAKVQKHLDDLNAGKITSFTDKVRTSPSAWNKETKDVVTSVGDPAYPRKLQIAIANAESMIRHLGHDEKVYENKVANWKAKPLPGASGAAA